MEQLTAVQGKISGELLATIFIFLTLIVKEAILLIKEKPKQKKEKETAKTLIKIERFTSVLANQYTTTFPESIVEQILKVMFNHSRYLIYSTLIDWIRGEDLRIPRVKENIKSQIEKLIKNAYDNDKDLLSGKLHDNISLSDYMDPNWINIVTKSCITFIDSHSMSGNDFNVLHRNLKNDFTAIENEFLKKMKE